VWRFGLCRGIQVPEFSVFKRDVCRTMLVNGAPPMMHGLKHGLNRRVHCTSLVRHGGCNHELSLVEPLVVVVQTFRNKPIAEIELFSWRQWKEEHHLSSACAPCYPGSSA
jgi:hypothetical protein